MTKRKQKIAEFPECPEFYYHKELCRAASVKSCWCDCLALDSTDFKDGRCPFYKSDDQYYREVEKYGSDPLDYTAALEYIRRKKHVHRKAPKT